MYIIFLLLIILLACIITNEGFHNYFPFPIGISTRNTRGMTYDMRCVPNIKKMYIPWGYATMYPNHYGKCLELI